MTLRVIRVVWTVVIGLLTGMRTSSLLLVLILSVGALYLVVPVYAQTISISNLQYPTNVVGGKQVLVSFTIIYSGATPGSSYLVAGIGKQDLSDWVTGSVISSSPDHCATDSYRTWAASCYYQPSNVQGSEDVAFSLTSLSSVGTYSFAVDTFIEHYSASDCQAANQYWCYDALSANNPFSISLIDKFTLTVSLPGQVSVSLDGVQQGAGSLSLQLSPGTHVISAPNIVQIDSTSRLKFNGWSDGSTQTIRTFDLESDTEIVATYVTQYLVNATSDSTLQPGWYDKGTVLQFAVDNTPLVNKYRLLFGGFDGWYNGGQLISKSPSASYSIDAPVNLTDRWNYLPYVPPVLIVVLVAVLLFFARQGIIPTPRLPELKMLRHKRTRKRIRRSKPKLETVTPESESQVAQTLEIEESKPSKRAKTTMFCNQCGAVVPRDSKFCKECGSKQT